VWIVTVSTPRLPETSNRKTLTLMAGGVTSAPAAMAVNPVFATIASRVVPEHPRSPVAVRTALKCP
jgi:hypothetical protein